MTEQLVKDIIKACGRAGVKISKTCNIPTNIGFRAENAFAMQMEKLQKERGAPDEILMQIVQLEYKNYRGEYSTRTILPLRIEFGQTEWHPEFQWFLYAYDFGKRAERTFALKDCNFTRNLRESK